MRCTPRRFTRNSFAFFTLGRPQQVAVARHAGREFGVVAQARHVEQRRPELGPRHVDYQLHAAARRRVPHVQQGTAVPDDLEVAACIERRDERWSLGERAERLHDPASGIPEQHTAITLMQPAGGRPSHRVMR